jgi:N-acyl-D-aspartate/D-glutamate deacylase
VIRAGAYADLVLFDPVTVRDASTFAEPTRTAEGIWKPGSTVSRHISPARGLLQRMPGGW